MAGRCRTMIGGKKLLLPGFVLPATWLSYAAIVLEILFMISPFGIYFYSVYAHPLRFLNQHSSTAWLTTFVMPHFSETHPRWLSAVTGMSNPLLLIGFVIFAIGFIQIYAAKLITRREVTGGLYRWIRHPQYLGLAIMGLGAFLLWPRYLVLLGLVLMLFIYYRLARYEEAQCEERYGTAYREYRARTGMFLPIRALPKVRWPRSASPAVRFVMNAGLLVGLLATAKIFGSYLQDYSISVVSRLPITDGMVVTPAGLTAEDLSRATALAMSDPEVRLRLSRAGYGAGARLLVYVVPENWKLPDLPMEVSTGGHYTPRDFPPGRFKVLFTIARSYDAGLEGDAILKYAYARTPVVLVREVITANEITSLETPPAHVRWGDIPTPLF